MRPFNILVLESNPDWVLLIQEGFAEIQSKNNLHFVNTGLEMVSFLRQEGEHEMKPRPDLIFIELNLPHENPLELLKEIKSTREFQNIPVIILTILADLSNVNQCYVLGANCYVVKPPYFDALINVIQVLEKFWFKIATLPSQD